MKINIYYYVDDEGDRVISMISNGQGRLSPSIVEALRPAWLADFYDNGRAEFSDSSFAEEYREFREKNPNGA